MLLSWKGLRESISWHVVSGKPVHVQTTLLHFLTEPHVMDADVTKLCLQLGGILDQQMKSLLIVTINHRLVSRVEGNCLEELYPTVQLFVAVRTVPPDQVRLIGSTGLDSGLVLMERSVKEWVSVSRDSGGGLLGTVLHTRQGLY